MIMSRICRYTAINASSKTKKFHDDVPCKDRQFTKAGYALLDAAITDQTKISDGLEKIVFQG